MIPNYRIWSIRLNEKTKLLPLPILFLLTLYTLIWLPSADAECVRTGLLDTQTPPPSAGESGDTILSGIFAEGDHLMVTVQSFKGVSGSLSLIDGEGLIVAEEAVILGSGEIGHVLLVDALAEIPARGFQFTLRLESLVTGVPEVAAEKPVHIGLSCPTVKDCYLVAKPGFSTPGALVDAALIAALEEAEAAGSQDLLGFVLAYYPELAGSVYQLALALDESEASGSDTEASPDPDPCTCRWVPSVDLSTPLIATVSSNQKELASEWKRGVAGYAAGQTVDGTLSASFSAAFASLGMHLVCTLNGGATQQIESIQINGRPVESFEISNWAPCETQCMSTITHGAGSNLCTEAKVYGGGGKSAEADLRLDSQFLIDGNVQFAITAWTDLYVESTSTDEQLTATAKNKIAVVSSNDSVGKITLDGSFMASAARNITGDEGSYTFASASSGFEQSVIGGSECADGTSVSFAVDDSGGGEVLVRWGDPP